jgi:hypothetical protein
VKPHHPWTELVERYSRIEQRYEGDVPPPATNEAIRTMRKAAQSERLIVPDEYVDFLEVRNGVSFNGLMLYGADIDTDDYYRRLDLAVMNRYQFNRGSATILGTSDIDAYIVVGPDGPYQRLDRASWDPIDEFRTCGELLVSIFAAATQALKHGE